MDFESNEIFDQREFRRFRKEEHNSIYADLISTNIDVIGIKLFY